MREGIWTPHGVAVGCSVHCRGLGCGASQRVLDLYFLGVIVEGFGPYSGGVPGEVRRDSIQLKFTHSVGWDVRIGAKPCVCVCVCVCVHARGVN